jgi:hypothetical protein
MTNALSILAALACPAVIGIGLCAAAARNRRQKPATPPPSLHELRSEHQRLGERITVLESKGSHREP